MGFLWLDSNRDSCKCEHGLGIQPKSALLGFQALEVQIVQSLLQGSSSLLNFSVISDFVTVYVIISVGVLVKIISHSRYFQ